MHDHERPTDRPRGPLLPIVCICKIVIPCIFNLSFLNYFAVFVLCDHMFVQYRYVIEEERRTKKNVTPLFFNLHQQTYLRGQPACALPLPAPSARFGQVLNAIIGLEGRTREVTRHT